MTFDLALFSSKLKKYRNQFNASPIQVATATGIPEDALVALENGAVLSYVSLPLVTASVTLPQIMPFGGSVLYQTPPFFLSYLLSKLQYREEDKKKS